MILLTPQMKILVAIEPADFRCGIDGLVRLCKARLARDPFSGAVFVYRNRRSTAVKVLVYDGQGFWLCHKRLSEGRFHHWPSTKDRAATSLQAHELQVLLCGGNPAATGAAPVWHPVAMDANVTA